MSNSTSGHLSGLRSASLVPIILFLVGSGAGSLIAMHQVTPLGAGAAVAFVAGVEITISVVATWLLLNR